MADKILLSVKLPATGQSYEFRVPYDLTVEQSARLISSIFARTEAARYDASQDVDLMLLDGTELAGSQLNPNETIGALVEQGALVNGSHLALT